MADTPYKIYSQVQGLVLALVKDERLLSITVDAEDSDMTVDFVMENLAPADQVTVLAGRSWSMDYNGALRGPGSITFTNLGKYVVLTEKM